MSISAYNSDKQQIMSQVTDIYNIFSKIEDRDNRDKIEQRHSYETIYEETVSIRNREETIFWVTGAASSLLLIATLQVIFNRKPV
jgi:hypothetical protein